MSLPLLVLLLACLAVRAAGYVLDYLNLRYMERHGQAVPEELAQVLDAALLGRIRDYTREKTRFAMAASALSTAAVMLFFFGGPLDAYNSWIASLGLPFVPAGWLFFLLLYLAVQSASTPFTLYSTFRIEKKHGFNTMTGRVWLVDALKSALVTVVLLSGAAFGGFWLVEASPRFWWFWVWCFFLAFAVFVTYISPYVIEPLFNRFTPLDEGSLKARMVALARRAGINVGKVLKMDASKRSRHTNAYFTGLGRTKRIILFDTLLESMTHEEILAVLAHEIGHWKRRHVLKGLVLTQALSLVFLFAAFHLLSGPGLSTLFAVRVDSFYAKAAIAGFLAGVLSFAFAPLVNGFSRRLETEADRFACSLDGRPEAMVDVLVKLSKDNLSNLRPHPLYALFHYSHPPVLERIRRIREYCGEGETGRGGPRTS